MSEKKILFDPKPGGPRVTRIAHGEYTREFTAEKPPYEATPEEWEKFILPTGMFREVDTRARATGTSTKKE